MLMGPSTPGFVRPRDDWAKGLTPVGPLVAEPDVRILVVHHSESPNSYSPEKVPSTLQGFFRYHTSAQKGWNDIAYNFLIDRFGTVWEGRAGSLTGAVRGDATGGNQGFSQLCCFVGDHEVEPPSPAARSAMVGLLAWLADRHQIATVPGSMDTFTSLGSNRFSRGQSVTLRTVVGHRDVSQTACPGDAAYSWVAGSLAADITAARGRAVIDIEPSTSTSSTSSSTTSSTTSSNAVAPPPSPVRQGNGGAGGATDDDGLDPLVPVAGASALVLAGLAAAIRIRRRRL